MSRRDSAHADFPAVDEVEAGGHGNPAVALEGLGEEGAAGEVDDSDAHRIGGGQMNDAAAGGDVKTVGRGCGHGGDADGLRLLIDADPVEAGLVGVGGDGRSGPRAVADALVEDDVEGFVEGPLAEVEVGGVFRLGIREHFLAVDVPRQQVFGPLQAKGVVPAVGGGRGAAFGRVVALSLTERAVVGAVGPAGVYGVIGVPCSSIMIENSWYRQFYDILGLVENPIIDGKSKFVRVKI